ncbi:hypothetical protein [Leptospira noguchii]|uniref:hypothetical protein n=1 Tax=Leptospira noguchii TaxID=28182 RepID=UPI001FB647DC|nr:hypothetical protein [Leptospira noguchii]UOG32328.1 hypothetical protein MAL06_15135 [Leptospira noguchii]
METQHNAFLNSMHRSLRVALQGRVGNSTQRFPELNASLPKGRSAGSRWKLNTTLS